MLVGSVLAYVFYWITAIVILVYLKWKEGRATLFGYESAAGRARRVRMEERDRDRDAGSSSEGGSSPVVKDD